MASVGTRTSPLSEQRLDVGGIRTRAVTLAGDGPPLVLLHGYSDSADTWREVMAHLRVAGRGAVAVDLPGFAGADALDPTRGVLEQIGAFACELAQMHPGSVFAGNSLGGAAALIAAARTDHVAGLVPIAPAGFDMGGWITRLHRMPLLPSLVRAAPVMPAPVLQAVVGQIYRQLAICEQRAVRGEVVRRFAAHHRDRATALRYLEIADRLVPELSEPLDVTGVEVPTLVVWGRQDRMLPVRNTELVRERIPHARVTVLDPCGHCPQVERPRVIAELLLQETG
jgi:pimeloyl-ACP methyl ester carboxylesterase